MLLTYGSTFSGIGGLDLAVERVFKGARPIWHVEPDPYAAAVLRRHWPGVPNLQRVELIDATTPRPDIICGGFPCQDISSAGGGAGLDGPKSRLWWGLARAVRILRPSVVIVENSARLAARGLDRVIGEFSRLGYDAAWGALRAPDVDAPQKRRDRMFIVAMVNAAGPRCQGHEQSREGRRPESVRGGAGVRGATGAVACPGRLGRGDDWRARLQQGERSGRGGDPYGCHGCTLWPPPKGDQRAWAGWSGPQPGVRRSVDGPPRGLGARRRRASIRCLGNAVVPQQAEAAIRELWGRLNLTAEPAPRP